MNVGDSRIAENRATGGRELATRDHITGIVDDPVIAGVASNDRGVEKLKPVWQLITVVALAAIFVQENGSCLGVGLYPPKGR